MPEINESYFRFFLTIINLKIILQLNQKYGNINIVEKYKIIRNYRVHFNSQI